MKAFTERDPKRIGIVAVVVSLAVVVGVIGLNRSVFVPGYPIHARLSNAAGIAKGAPVTLAGVKVGSVSGVHVEGNAVVADLAIDHGIVLPHDTAAAVEVQTVLGVLDVALQPKTGWSRPLAPGSTIDDTSIPVEFQDLQNTAGTLLEQSDVQAFNQLLQSLEQVTQGKETQVATIVSGLDRFTTAVNQRRNEVGTLIDAADTLASTVSQRDSQLAGVVDDLASVVQGLASRSSDLSALIVQTDQVAAQTANLVGENQPQLQGLLDHLQSVLAVVSKHQEDLAQGVSYLAAAVRGFSSIGYSGPTNSPNSWANIYANVVGLANGYAVLGNCAALDLALNAVLGPDPMPCDEGSGPPAGQTAQTSGGPGSDASSPSSTAGQLGPASASATPSSVNPLAALLSPLVGAP
ncbi:MAG TPA: MCE family protein [Acidimicrobiales bacterium]|nr:MCE family protein [Acidimicrobiales bacterium]